MYEKIIKRKLKLLGNESNGKFIRNFAKYASGKIVTESQYQNYIARNNL
jgi:hypothetical protein